MSTNAENDDKSKESGVTIRTSVRGTIPGQNLKAFVFIVRSLCPENAQPMEIREHDRIFSPAPDVTAPKNSVRIRSRLQQCAPQTSAAHSQLPPQSQAQQAQSQAQSQAKSQPKIPPTNPGTTAGTNSSTVSGVSVSASNVNRVLVSMPVGPVVLTFTNIKDRRVAPPYERRAITTVTATSGRETEGILSFLGCVFEYEYVRKGMRHFTRGGLVVDVFAVDKLSKPGDPSSTTQLIPDGPLFVFEVWSDNVPSPEPLITFLQLLSPYISVPSAS